MTVVQMGTNNSLSNVVGHFSISYKMVDLPFLSLLKSLKNTVFSNSLKTKTTVIQNDSFLNAVGRFLISCKMAEFILGNVR